MSEAIRIDRATCRAVYVFDVGREIDLGACRRLVPELVREPIVEPPRPGSIQVEAPPLRLEAPCPAPRADGLRAEPQASIAIYDLGAVAVTFAFPVAGTLDDLRDASCALASSSAMTDAARKLAAELLARVASAVTSPSLSLLVEEYLVFEVTAFRCPEPLARAAANAAPVIAAVLRSEASALSEQEIAHATSTQVSRTPNDLAILDWNAALVFHDRPHDVRAVLELANVQLLEVRFLDRTLDVSLDRSYAIVSERRTWRTVLPHALSAAMRRVSERQVDAAILHERVSNALKLVGDQHLARVYRGAAERFELAQWNAANLQKLATLESIYQKVNDRAAVLRAEILEWIIIVLIAASMAMPLLH